MRTDLSSIKEADSSVNGVVAYFILLSGAALQHPPPAKRRCNLSGEINIKCMCKAVAWWLFIGWVGNIDYGAPPPPPPTYSGNEKQTFTAGGGGQSASGPIPLFGTRYR